MTEFDPTAPQPHGDRPELPGAPDPTRRPLERGDSVTYAESVRAAPAAAPAARVPSCSGTYTGEEVQESMTGYDEIGVVKAFGHIEDMRGNMPAYALVFVLFRRDGLKHDEALAAALSLTKGQVEDVFADDPDDVMPDDPDSAAGKGASSPSATPTS